MERIMRHQVCEVVQLHQTVDKIVRMLEAHAALKETQWLSMKERLEKGERKWNGRHKQDLL